MNKPARSIALWAPIHMPKRGQPYINWTCMSTTRREAKRLLLEFVIPERQAEMLKRVRFARVSIAEDVKS